MKHVIITFLSIFLSYGAIQAGTTGEASQRTFGYSNSMIFVEGGITFSVYPDGEFDFFIDQPSYLGAAYHSPGVSISFNSGFNYDPWVQYDDYGAVIQIENTPVYYDFYGRVNRIGNINVWYNRGRVSRIGGLYVYYDAYGGFSRFQGYVNVYNRQFVYRPVYNYFVRPAARFCIVNPRPYRRYYHPVRYTYYRPYNNNHRRAYANVGRTYHHKGKNPRSSVYMNDRRVVNRRDVQVRRDIRDRSLRYEKNKRGYNKSTPNSNGRKKTVANNTRGYNKDYKPRRNPSGKGYNRNYNAKNKKPVRVSSTRTTEVKKGGKTITRSTTVNRTKRNSYQKPQRAAVKKSRAYSKKDNRKSGKNMSRTYSSRSKSGNAKNDRSTRGRKNRS
ncbi:hypothetical protein [Robertkochia flava]|uniref:hypothetical protein n=1 Tax=Robertkochia flava TaxID=3447986 RepID=UPI001CCF62EA|nr:hypothetical protein [Robertkochia marina]